MVNDVIALLSLWYSTEALRHRLLCFHVHPAGDHDPLRLWGTRAVHRFRQIADGRRPHGQVLDEPEDSHPVLYRDVRLPPAVFLDPTPRLRSFKVLLGGEGHKKPPGDVLGDPGDLIGKTGNVLFMDIGEKGIHHIGSARFPMALRRAGDAAAVKGFVQVVHLNDLVADVRRRCNPVELRRRLGGADKDVSDTDLAGVALPVVGGELLDEGACEFIFAAEEDPFPGDEDIVEDDEGLMAAEEEISPIEGSSFQLSGIAGLAAEDIGDPRVCRWELRRQRRTPCLPPSWLWSA